MKATMFQQHITPTKLTKSTERWSGIGPIDE